MVCKICFNQNRNKVYLSREMVFGFRDEFEYFECPQCGCLQIKEYPKNLAKYYPENYYSYHQVRIKKNNKIVNWARKKRALFGLSGKSLAGKLIAKIKLLPNYYQTLRKCNLNLHSKILEIGCGSGTLLKQIQREGFKDLIGVDAYLPSDKVENTEGFKLINTDLDEFCLTHDNTFDLVMMHHSLEHMHDHHEIFKMLFRLIKTEGFLWVTMPIIGYAWRHYGVNWCGLDAPRHLIIHSKKSFNSLCQDTYFSIVEITYNSTDYQFIASEQYAMDIPLLDKRSYIVNQRNSVFTKEQIEYFKEKAIELNKKLDGDSASFLLKKSVYKYSI